MIYVAVAMFRYSPASVFNNMYRANLSITEPVCNVIYSTAMPFDLSFFQKTVNLIEEKQIDTFTSLSGSSGALLFCMTEGQALLLCSSERSAAEFHSDTIFWSKLLNIHPPVLISPEGSPERLKSLVKLHENKEQKFIASVNSSTSPIWDDGEFNSVRISKGVVIDRDGTVQRFYEQGYFTVSMVSKEGEMSVRGGIIDVFPPDTENPARIEFFGDEVESIRFFDIDTQLSLKEIDEITIPPALEPEEGPGLIEYLPDSMIVLNEADDIKRQYPEFIESITDRGIVKITSLHLSGEGMNCEIDSVSGLGLLPGERRTIDDFIERADDLAGQHYIVMVCASEGQAKRLKELFFELDLEAPIMSVNSAFKYTRSPVITTGELSRGFKYKNIIAL